MNGRFIKAIGSFHRGQKGITGLETAIILIAFVTVAAVLAYSVLSAGIFSSERGKEAVYKGLETAQATMKVTSSVYATGTVDPNPTLSKLDTISFQLSSVLQNENVDLGKCTVNFANDSVAILDLSDALITGIGKVADGMLRPSEVKNVEITVTSFNLNAYDTFTIEIIPPTGATIRIQKNLPGLIETNMNLD